MAVVDLNTTEWHNADGLLVKFGPGEVKVTRGGQYETVESGKHVVEVTIDLQNLSAVVPVSGGNQCIIADNVVIPRGALLEKAQIVIMEATAGTNANLNIGLVQLDRSTETSLDFDGLIVAADGWHTSAIGTTVDYSQGSEDHGALLGTVTLLPGLLVAFPDTGDFTAGVVKFRLWYSIPLAADLVSP